MFLRTAQNNNQKGKKYRNFLSHISGFVILFFSRYFFFFLFSLHQNKHSVRRISIIWWIIWAIKNSKTLNNITKKNNNNDRASLCNNKKSIAFTFISRYAMWVFYIVFLSEIFHIDPYPIYIFDNFKVHSNFKHLIF